MNMNPSDPDPALSRLLREWQPQAELPPRFQDRVWERVAGEERPAVSNLWAAFRDWLDTRFRRPVVALGYVAVLMSIGLGVGHWHGRADAAQLQDELKARYLQQVNPFLH